MKNTKERVAKLQDRLREALELKEIRAIDLSRMTGVPKGAISYYLLGKSTPKADRLFILCKALDVSEAWMLGYDVPMARKPEQKKNDQLAELIVKMRSDVDFFEAVASLHSLTPEQFDSVLQMIRLLSRQK